MEKVEIVVSGGCDTVCPMDAMGYEYDGHEVVAYDVAAARFFLSGGGTASHGEVAFAGLDPPVARGRQMPCIGQYVTCWLGDAVVVAAARTAALLRTNGGVYSVACHMLQPLHGVSEVGCAVVLYGNGQAALFRNLTVRGGAAGLRETIESRLRAAGVRVGPRTVLVERQSATCGATALRQLPQCKRLVLQLQGTCDGVAKKDCGFAVMTADAALAHVTATELLEGKPWLLPISLELLGTHIGVHDLRVDHLMGPYTTYDDGIVVLDTPQRPVSGEAHTVTAEQLVWSVRSGTVEVQPDGTFAMPAPDGTCYVPVTCTGRSLRALELELYDLYDACLPIGEHKVELPGCPPSLLLERFGTDFYNPETGIVSST